MEKLVGNPIHVFNLIHRIVKTLLPVLASLKSCHRKTEMVEKSILGDLKVSEADLVGAMQSLMRIQFIYRFYFSFLSRANSVSSSALTRLTWHRV